ncbi:hypothetical protein C0Q70_18456 [Pomacea canaliculata]|uniref:Uncharacterized protein n=1 Tax=Pomacea canaliculata TaxID=400727 RepID=A0A2T7NGN8_POMCA|nr:hypothetical protein C0Q70_18456 [Pomacea canaliculata]
MGLSPESKQTRRGFHNCVTAPPGDFRYKSFCTLPSSPFGLKAVCPKMETSLPTLPNFGLFDGHRDGGRLRGQVHIAILMTVPAGFLEDSRVQQHSRRLLSDSRCRGGRGCYKARQPQSPASAAAENAIAGGNKSPPLLKNPRTGTQSTCRSRGRVRVGHVACWRTGHCQDCVMLQAVCAWTDAEGADMSTRLVLISAED